MQTQQSPPRILRRREVERRVGLSKPTLYRRIEAGSFPKSVPLGARAVGWLSTEIDQWIAEQAGKRA
ncbi:helix-turn-helix transcriptional regulator [Candidatus Palauibacter sp.]|uniref:helix-turn-helix transcriptional regulator n=1 Tax=Candidatus Palauibacter sp. TaxID=3101350 RepID=UPI003AF244DF